jgi:hypothetical protein
VEYLFEKKYKKEELESSLKEEDIQQLLKNGVMSVISNKAYYSIQFVGLVFLGKKTLAILPKFLEDEDIDKPKTIKLILKVLSTYEKFSDKFKNRDDDYLIVNLESDQVSDFFVANFLLNDFVKNGYYTKSTTTLKKNGEGEISWEKTISDITPILSNRVPYYFDTYNFNKDNDILNKVILLHKWVIKEFYDEFADLLGLRVNIDRSIPDIGEIWSQQFINSLLDKELRTTYSDNKILVLKALKTFFNKSSFFQKRRTTLFGTRNFQNVWEHICSFVFKNEYINYQEEIPRPKWENLLDNKINEEKRTLKPDVIRNFNSYLLILDAKYYNIKFDQKDLIGNPGVEDVVKQLIYEKALQTGSGIIKRNAFLFPKKLDIKFNLFGTVKMDFISLKPINLIYLSYEEVFNLYVKRKPYSNDTLNDFIQLLK